MKKTSKLNVTINNVTVTHKVKTTSQSGEKTVTTDTFDINDIELTIEEGKPNKDAILTIGKKPIRGSFGHGNSSTNNAETTEESVPMGIFKLRGGFPSEEEMAKRREDLMKRMTEERKNCSKCDKTACPKHPNFDPSTPITEYADFMTFLSHLFGYDSDEEQSDHNDDTEENGKENAFDL